MTVINPHDMTRHYTLWGVCLALSVAAGGMMYSFQPHLELPLTIPPVVHIILQVVSGMAVLVAISFKYVFSQEMVSWVLLQVLVIVGSIVIALYGYRDLYLTYYVIAFAGTLAFGPYLHFD